MHATFSKVANATLIISPFLSKSDKNIAKVTNKFVKKVLGTLFFLEHPPNGPRKKGTKSRLIRYCLECPARGPKGAPLGGLLGAFWGPWG